MKYLCWIGWAAVALLGSWLAWYSYFLQLDYSRLPQHLIEALVSPGEILAFVNIFALMTAPVLLLIGAILRLRIQKD